MFVFSFLWKAERGRKKNRELLSSDSFPKCPPLGWAETRSWEGSRNLCVWAVICFSSKLDQKQSSQNLNWYSITECQCPRHHRNNFSLGFWHSYLPNLKLYPRLCLLYYDFNCLFCIVCMSGAVQSKILASILEQAR